MTENGNKTEARIFAKQAVLHWSDTVKQSNCHLGQEEGGSRENVPTGWNSQSEWHWPKCTAVLWIVGHVDWLKKVLAFSSYNLNVAVLFPCRDKCLQCCFVLEIQYTAVILWKKLLVPNSCWSLATPSPANCVGWHLCDRALPERFLPFQYYLHKTLLLGCCCKQYFTERDP